MASGCVMTRGRGRSGVTLVEVVIALTMFWICVAGIGVLFMTAKELSDKSRDHYVAANIAKNRIERAGLFTQKGQFIQIFDMAESNTVVDVNGVISGNGSYRRTTTVTRLTNKTDVADMIVTVEIRNRKTLAFGGEREIARTLFTEFNEP